jgi:hypothetical protein
MALCMFLVCAIAVPNAVVTVSAFTSQAGPFKAATPRTNINLMHKSNGMTTVATHAQTPAPLALRRHFDLHLLGRGADLGPSSSQSSVDTHYQNTLEPLRRSSLLLQSLKRIKFTSSKSRPINKSASLGKSLLMAAKTRTRRTLSKTSISTSSSGNAATSRRRRSFVGRGLKKPVSFNAVAASPVTKFVGDWAWTSPFFVLAVAVPLHYAVVHNTFPALPACYPLQRPFHHYESAALGGVVMTKLLFLLSNVAYFASGSYLCNVKIGNTNGNTTGKKRFFRADPSSASPAALDISMSSLELTDDTDGTDSKNDLAFSKWLGGTVWASGVVSAIYHIFQSIDVSDYFAETLCFLDHGVAMSSVLYFIKVCGIPRLRTAMMGALSLVALKPKGAAYAYTHSVWHFLSAAVTISWAHDGIQRHKRRKGTGNFQAAVL